MPSNKPPRPFLPRGLMARMGHALGINLVKAQEDGLVAPQTVQRMQGHCSACARPGACNKLLKGAPQGLYGPPSYCVNRNLMKALKDSVETNEKTTTDKS